MRYEATINYLDKQVKVKMPNKVFANKYELPEFLRMVRELHQIPIQNVHMITDWPTEECQAFEDGTMKIPKEYLESFLPAFKLPAKIKYLGYVKEKDTKKYIALKLKELRIEHEIPQMILASQIGIARSTYACYETGTNTPDLLTLIKFADYYNVTLDYLVGRYENNK